MPKGRMARGAVLVAVAAAAAGCALTPVNYTGTQSGRYDDGRTWHYSGGKFADQKDGKGVMVWSDGDRFEGEWVAYKGPQRGTMRYRSGATYTGPVATNYAPQGIGRYDQANGCSYEGEHDNGRYHGQGVLRCPDGFTYTGAWRNDKREGQAVVVFSNGDRYEGLYVNGVQNDPAALYRWAAGGEYRGRWNDGKFDGAGIYTRPDGGRYRRFMRADGEMARIPLPATPAPLCTGIPADWVPVEGRCDAAGAEGPVVLVSADGMRRFSALWRGGAIQGAAVQIAITVGKYGDGATRIVGTATAPGQFTSGTLEWPAPAAGGKGGQWKKHFEGTLVGTAAGDGKCLYREQWEECAHDAAGQRIDRIAVARADAEAEDRRRRDAEREAEERAERRAAAAWRAERDAREAEERAEGRAAMNAAILGGLAQMQQNAAQLRALDRQTSQLVAQAARERDEREAKRQADARREREREQAERDAARRRQAAAAAAAAATTATSAGRSGGVTTVAATGALAGAAQHAAQEAERRKAEAERIAADRAAADKAAADKLAAQKLAAEKLAAEKAAADKLAAEKLAAEKLAAEKLAAEKRAAEAAAKREAEAERLRAEEAARKTALAFCWRSINGSDHWFCDGRVQETLIGEKGDKGLDEQLGLVGCKTPRRLTTGEITLTGSRGRQRSGHVYDCGYKLDAGDTGTATWNRDIRRWWQGIVW